MGSAVWCKTRQRAGAGQCLVQVPCYRGVLGRFNLWFVRPVEEQTCRDVTHCCFRVSTTIISHSHQHGLLVINVLGFWTDSERHTAEYKSVTSGLNISFARPAFAWWWFYIWMWSFPVFRTPRSLSQSLMVWVLRWMLLPTELHVQVSAWLFLFFPWKYCCRVNLDYVYFGVKTPTLTKAVCVVS